MPAAAAAGECDGRHPQGAFELHPCLAATGQSLAVLLLPAEGTVADLCRAAEEERAGEEQQDFNFHLFLGGRFPEPYTPLVALGLKNGSVVDLVRGRPLSVLTAASDGTAKVFNAETGLCTLTLPGQAQRAGGRGGFSPDGRREVILPRPGGPTAKIQKVATGQCQVVLSGHHTERLNAATFSPEGFHVATASADGTAQVWNARTGQCVKTLDGHKGEVLSVAFSLDGRRLVTTSDDRTAKVFCIGLGGCTMTLKGHNWAVNAASFSPDGRYVVTTSDDRTAKIWDWEMGKCLQTFEGHTSPVMQAVFSHCWRYSAGADAQAAEKRRELDPDGEEPWDRY